MDKTQSEQVELCLNYKTWTGLTIRQLATAGRIVVREGHPRQQLYNLADEVIGKIDHWEADKIRDELQERGELIEAIARKTVELYESKYPAHQRCS
tara:strand:- start:555 stop:842 length:288 start_codon:yes stop_codon:yes gene_type:complete